MSENGKNDGSQMEINISNKNSNSQIVINDLYLLKLIYAHPYLISKAVHSYGDKDYEEWGWQEIAGKFNRSYKEEELNTPFTAEELQWRWDVLRSICPSLKKAFGQIPDELWHVVFKINRLLNARKQVEEAQPTDTQKYMLSQLPLMERLSKAQQRSLEVEVMDAILSQERLIQLKPTIENAETIVQNQCQEFLEACCLKEMFPIVSPAIIEDNSKNTVTSNKKNTKGRKKTSCSKNTSATSDIVQGVNNKKIMSGVSSHQESQDKESADKNTTPPQVINNKPLEQVEVTQELIEEDGTSSANELELRYVPLKSVKLYTRKVQVKLKRLKMKDNESLTSIKKRKS